MAQWYAGGPMQCGSHHHDMPSVISNGPRSLTRSYRWGYPPTGLSGLAASGKSSRVGRSGAWQGLYS